MANVTIWGVVLGFFGLIAACVVWFMLRFMVGALAAALGFYAILVATSYSIVSLIA